jgi:hypothetical protein
MVRHGHLKTDKHDIRDHLKAHFMITDIFLNELDQSSVTGFCLIDDGSNLTLSQSAMLTPPIMKKAVTIFQEAYPMRPKKVHLINMNPIMEKFIAMLQIFLNEKMRARQQVHSKDWKTTLVEDLGPDVLPEEYGGTNGKIQDHISMLLNSSFFTRVYT